jgi:predicted acetyltransferase
MQPAPQGYRAVTLAEDRRAEVLDVDSWAFAGDVPDEDALGGPAIRFPWDRAVGIEDADGSLIAFHSSYPFSMPVPGGSVPTAGLTWVGVHPAHRRKGLLGSMIRSHFERARERGEATSALFAAEPAIYGRFGYGRAALDLRMTIPRGAALRPVAGSAELTVRMERIDVALHTPVVDAVHLAAGAGRPGWIARGAAAVTARHLVAPDSGRRGGETLKILIVDDGETPVGYALFSRKGEWTNTGPHGLVHVREAVAATPAAAHRLWTTLLDLDLMATVDTWLHPVDDALLQLLVDNRVAEPRISDNLWVRILDLPVALAARRYPSPVDVVLEVTDALIPSNAGQWRLTGGPDGAAVDAAPHAEPDLSLDIRELGAAYLGGVSLAALATAGLVVPSRPGTLGPVAAAFSWPLAPVCTWIF